MDHGRVEVGTLVEGRDDDDGRKAGRDLRESIMSAVEAPWDVGLEGRRGGGVRRSSPEAKLRRNAAESGRDSTIQETGSLPRRTTRTASSWVTSKRLGKDSADHVWGSILIVEYLTELMRQKSSASN